MESQPTSTHDGPVTPEVLPTPEDGTETAQTRPHVSEPSKLIRIASMTRAMLEEVREAPLDDAGRDRLRAIYDRSLAELKDVMSNDLVEELDAVFIPIDDGTPTEAELRVAQAQLVGWLEGLFHGIQASLITQQMAAAAQLDHMRQPKHIDSGGTDTGSGLYL